MQLTKNRLRQIIKEELGRVLSEQDSPPAEPVMTADVEPAAVESGPMISDEAWEKWTKEHFLVNLSDPLALLGLSSMRQIADVERYARMDARTGLGIKNPDKLARDRVAAIDEFFERSVPTYEYMNDEGQVVYVGRNRLKPGEESNENDNRRILANGDWFATKASWDALRASL